MEDQDVFYTRRNLYMNFTKKGVENKQDMLVSRLPRNKKKVQVIVFKLILVMLLLCPDGII